jgi:hypothetical protein
MRCVMTPEQRTLLVELIAAELAQANATALAAGADPVGVRRALAVRIIALRAQLDGVRQGT